jgi:hypothetical protein
LRGRWSRVEGQFFLLLRERGRGDVVSDLWHAAVKDGLLPKVGYALCSPALLYQSHTKKNKQFALQEARPRDISAMKELAAKLNGSLIICCDGKSFAPEPNKVICLLDFPDPCGESCLRK